MARISNNMTIEWARFVHWICFCESIQGGLAYNYNQQFVIKEDKIMWKGSNTMSEGLGLRLSVASYSGPPFSFPRGGPGMQKYV